MPVKSIIVNIGTQTKQWRIDKKKEMQLCDFYILMVDKLKLHTRKKVIIVHKTCHGIDVE